MPNGKLSPVFPKDFGGCEGCLGLTTTLPFVKRSCFDTRDVASSSAVDGIEIKSSLTEVCPANGRLADGCPSVR